MTLTPLDAAGRALAVAAASAARGRRAVVKADLKAGRLRLGDVFELAGTDPIVARMGVPGLLAALPRIGPVRAGELMAEVGIAANRRVGGLGVGQRQELLRLVG